VSIDQGGSFNSTITAPCAAAKVVETLVHEFAHAHEAVLEASAEAPHGPTFHAIHKAMRARLGFEPVPWRKGARTPLARGL
jgi:hypothetical protein